MLSEDPQCPFADTHIEEIFDFDDEELVDVAKELEELEREIVLIEAAW